MNSGAIGLGGVVAFIIGRSLFGLRGAVILAIVVLLTTRNSADQVNSGTVADFKAILPSTTPV